MNKISTKRLGDILNFKRGYDLPLSSREDGAIPVISSAGISGCHSEFKAEGEGVITGRYGTLGEVYYVEGKYWPHNTTLYVTDFKSNYPKYVYYLLKCLGNLKTSDKSAVPGINRNDLHEVRVPYIKGSRQIEIANILDNLDAKIEVNNKINAELEAMAKLIYDYWFVQFDFPNEDGKPYKSSGGKMVYNKELKREIPEGWEVKELQEFALTGSGATPLKSKKEFYENPTIPWINSGEVNESFIVSAKKFISEKGLVGSSAKLYPKGTILMAMYGATAGQVSLIDLNACTNQAICAILPEDECFKYFIKFGLEDLYCYLVNLSSGSARDNLSQDKIRKLIFFIPDSNSIRNFHTYIKPMMDRILLNLKENQKLAELRDWLLPMLMNGQVTVANEELGITNAELGNDLGMVAEEGETYKTK